MKKKVLMLVIILICIYPVLASASYACSNETAISESLAEIEAGKSKTINGLGVGLIEARDMGIARRFTAELIVDARRVSLDNITSSEEIELLSGIYTVSLVNSTNEDATIKIDGSSKTIIKGESEDIKNLKVFLVSSEGEYPFKTTVLVGKERISLSSDKDSSKIIVIEGTDYALELFSASNSDATIKVNKCGDSKIIEIKEDITSTSNITTSENITSEGNITILEDINNTNLANETKCNIAGFRNEDSYCDKNKSLVTQKEKEESCSENYECKTNYCKAEKCSEFGIFSRIILWFKNLFS